jgi:CubicO group peptidase (beta-lactamase class C family)
MQRFLRCTLFAVAALLFAPAVPAAEFATVQPGAAGLSAERLQRLDAAQSAYVANGQLAGQVTLVLRDGRVVYSKADGWRDQPPASR